MAELPPPFPQTVDAIYRAIAANRRGGDSAGIAMSDAVNPCDRYLFYKLHWAAPLEEIDGLRQSRFDTGNYWETRLLDELAATGAAVDRVDPETDRQFAAELAGGHLRGKLDGRAIGLPEAPKTEHVIECKSLKGEKFRAVVKHGLAKAVPEHFAQCQLYCHATGTSRALYLCVNKDTDERHAERIAYDPVFCLTTAARIERIVAMQEPPPKLHDDPNAKGAFQCGFCQARSICHEKAWPRSNCRTCLRSTPARPAWLCEKHGPQPYPAQQLGCKDHRFLPGLVPGIQEDVREPDLVVYRLHDGRIWTDGGEK